MHAGVGAVVGGTVRKTRGRMTDALRAASPGQLFALCECKKKLLLLIKKVSRARLRESGIHPISPKTPAPQYQPIDRKKIKEKKVEDYSRDRAA